MTRPALLKAAHAADGMSSGQIDRFFRERLHARRNLYSLDVARLQEAGPDLILTQDLCELYAIAPEELPRAVDGLFPAPLVPDVAHRLD